MRLSRNALKSRKIHGRIHNLFCVFSVIPIAIGTVCVFREKQTVAQSTKQTDIAGEENSGTL
jgi:hypothetical protein